MNGHRTERQTQSRRGAIPGIAACRDGVGRVQVVNRAPDQAANRHSHAAGSRQRQQWAPASLLALSVRGSRVDVQEHRQTIPGRPSRAWSHFLHQARQLPKDHKLVCRDVGPLTPPCRHGLWAAGLAAWRVFTMAGRNCIPLPQNRTYEVDHRPQNRTRERNHRPQKGTYGGQNRYFLGPKTVHLLDMPSVGPKSRQFLKVSLRLSLGSKARAPPRGQPS